ncbi:MAG: type 2 isopentenyl-diphosphate Delta-isomerase [Bacillota bacterium]|nr:type 2 isopentenyl-diphosphate Delta-isomerase [Bacillota bacterium]
MRKSRKQEHIENYLMSSYKGSTLFENVYVEHNALSNKNLEDIDTSMELFGKKISFPFMINAITGGTDFANEINENLAKIALEENIPMAVGSQKIALDDKDADKSFKLVRNVNKDGLIFANLSAMASLEECKEAIAMIDADAIQLHLNLAQEFVMAEGDKNFKNLSANIKELAASLDKPIIVKEVGTGISGKVGQELYDLGIRNIDVAGTGGTNFIEIENLRNSDKDYSDFFCWGVPTALALLEIKDLEKDDLFVISSGGVKKPSDILKSLVLGADMCAGSGELINYLLRGGYESALAYVKGLKENLRIYMALLNVDNLKDLKKVEYKIFGKLKNLYY